MSNKSNVVILGSTGFIGRQLEAHLQRSANLCVIGKDLPATDLTERESSGRILRFFTPDACVIVASAVKRQFGDTLDAFQKNVAIVENVCRLLEKSPVRQVVYFSSAAVYGEETDNIRISEDTQVNPTSFYGIAKFTSERLLRKTCLDNKVPSLICLRPPLIYGPGDQARTYGPSGFCASALEGAPITLWGDGTELREFIFIDDFCRIVEHLLFADFFGEVNVVSGNRSCFADVIDILKAGMPDLDVGVRERTRQKADNAFVADRIKALLPPDFRFTSLKDGVEKTLNQHGVNPVPGRAL